MTIKTNERLYSVSSELNFTKTNGKSLAWTFCEEIAMISQK